MLSQKTHQRPLDVPRGRQKIQPIKIFFKRVSQGPKDQAMIRTWLTTGMAARSHCPTPVLTLDRSRVCPTPTKSKSEFNGVYLRVENSSRPRHSCKLRIYGSKYSRAVVYPIRNLSLQYYDQRWRIQHRDTRSSFHTLESQNEIKQALRNRGQDGCNVWFRIVYHRQAPSQTVVMSCPRTDDTPRRKR